MAPRPFAFLVVALVLVTPALARAGDVAFDFADCEYFEIEVKVDPEVVRPWVPAGFEVRVFGDGTATVIHGGTRCADARSGMGEGPAVFGWTSVKLAVPADPELRGEEVDVYLYRIEHFSDGGHYASLLVAGGATDLQGASIEPGLEPAVSHGRVTTAAGSHVITAPTPPLALHQTLFSGVHWREFSSTGAGSYAFLDATLQPDDAAGQTMGVIETAPGTTTAALLGESNFGRALYGRAWAIRDGTVGVIG